MTRTPRLLLRILVLAVAVGVLGVAAGSASAAFVEQSRWGRVGTGLGEFGGGVLGGGAARQYDDPAGIAVAGDGTVLVVDTSNNRVERFTPDGRFLQSFGRRGRDAGSNRIIMRDRFLQPEGIARDAAGNLFVTDSGNDRIQKFNSTGHFRTRLAKHGSYPGQVVQPWGLAVGGPTVFAIDQGNYRIQRYSTSGRFLGSFGHFGRRPGQLVTPYGIAATAAGDRVYVSDAIKDQVMVFGAKGAFLGAFGSRGSRNGEFLKPAGVALGPDGSVFVGDRCNGRVQHFTADGAFIEAFGAGTLQAPTFLATNPAGDVFVSDDSRVVRFAVLTAPTGYRSIATGARRSGRAAGSGRAVICAGVSASAANR